MNTQPSVLNQLLVDQLVHAQKHDKQATENSAKGTRIEVPTTGSLLSSAYEQLRNAAEYAEEHLLLERAIKRFCKLNLVLTKHAVETLGQELIVELVQAGYLENGKIGTETAGKINVILKQYVQLYTKLRKANISREKATDWTLAFISVEAENLLTPHTRQQVIVYLAYQHFLQAIDREQFSTYADTTDYELCLYIAVQQAILKADADSVRYQLFTMYQLSPTNSKDFGEFNERIDELYDSKLTHSLKRPISRYGAPFRVLKGMIDDRPEIASLLPNKAVFMDAYRAQIQLEYKQVGNRLNKGLIKSIIFIIITKVLIGISIEVPYDILLHGSVIILPLAVNLLFPALYMATLKLSLSPPSVANAQTVSNYMEQVLYGTTQTTVFIPWRRKQSSGTKFLYTVFFLVPVALIILLLQRIGFNVVQMAIFFIFFSTASFLGFRLSTMVRELELTVRQTGLLASLRDFFYLPFIVSGQWISSKYSRLNLIARFLDIAIELPLKAVLRLMRQWIRFLNEKREELY